MTTGHSGRPLRALLGVLLVSGCALLAGCFGPVDDDAESEAALDGYFQGHDLWREGRFLEAAEKYKKWEAIEEARGEDSSETKGLIGHMLDLGGETEEARRLIDQSLNIRFRVSTCAYKLFYLSRHESHEQARAWIEAEPYSEAQKDAALAQFYRMVGDDRAELEHLMNTYRRIRGDESFEGVRYVGPTQFSDLLEHIAECHLRLGEVEMAHEFASKGVSCSQYIARSVWGWEGPRADAGSVACRVIRAQIAIRRGDWDAAEEECRLAQSILDGGTWSSRSEELKSLWSEIERSGKDLHRGK